MRLKNMKLRILLVIFCLLAGASLLLAGANDRFASVECLNETTLPRDAASQRTQLSTSFAGQGEHTLQTRCDAGGRLQTWSAPNSAVTPPGAWPQSATKSRRQRLGPIQLPARRQSRLAGATEKMAARARVKPRTEAGDTALPPWRQAACKRTARP